MNEVLPPQALEAWAAGLFEGEGSIAIRDNGTIVLTLSSTDLDVIHRFRDAVGAGKFHSQAAGKNGRTKRLWVVQISRSTEAVRVLRLMYPWLGERRSGRADEAFASLEDLLARKTYARACLECGLEFSPALGPNSLRKVYCNPKCRARRYDRIRRQEGSDRVG